jgi:hypothetical protein
MAQEIPKYALRAFGLLYIKFGNKISFSQDAFNWIVSSSMRKKIFSVLLKSGWIKKKSKKEYLCNEPSDIFYSFFEQRVPEMLKSSKRDYCFSRMSAVEIWTDFNYIQRSFEHNPYFINVKEEDLDYWKDFLASQNIAYFINEGTFMGEFVILLPKKNIEFVSHKENPVEKLEEAVAFCQGNSLFEYPLAYLVKKFKLKIAVSKELMEQVSFIV